jgi:transcriptional adapter 2-alpha
MRITIAPRRKKQNSSSSTVPTVSTKSTAKLDMGVKYHCDYCRKDISNVVRIRCAICQDFDLCVECFSVGAELSPHKNDHAYRVLTKIDFPVFADDWGADEELLLLEGIEMFGMGN